MLKVSAIFLLLFPFILNGQIKGRITDAETGEGLAGAAIVFNYQEGLITDGSGFFTLGSPDDSLVITVKHLGYKNKTMRISHENNFVHIELQPLHHSINELVVAAPAFGTRLMKNPGSIYLIPGEIINDHNPINIEEIINFSPGVYMASGNYNTNRLTIRGIGSRTPYGTNRIRAYFENIPLTNGDGLTSIEDIDVSGIGRIEIIKGPSSAIYGSGLGGVVKIYPEYLISDGPAYAFHSEAASFGTYRNILKTGYKKGNKQISLVYNNSISDGYRENSEYSRNSVFLFGKWLTRRADMNFTLNYIDLFAEIPSSINYDDFVHSPASAAGNWLQVEGHEKYKKLLTGFTATIYPSEDFKNRISIFTGYTDPYESRPFNILDENAFNYGLRNIFSFEKEKLRMLLGTELFSENYSWKIYETISGIRGELQNHNSEIRQYANFFFHAEYKPFDKFILESGLNYSNLRYEGNIKFPANAEDPEPKIFRPVSPSFGLNYEFHSLLHMYASVNHGFSAPSVEESLMPEGAINPDLEAEKGWAWDLGFRGNINNSFIYDLSFYDIELNDLLVTKRISEEIFYGINAGKASYRGIELFMSYNLPLDPDGRKEYLFMLSWNISENKFEKFIDEGIDYSGKELPGIPNQRLSLRTNIKPVRDLEILADFRYTGEMYLNDANTLSYGSWKTLDIKTSFYVDFENERPLLKLYAGIDNIFDEKYASMALVNAPSFGGNAPRYYYPALPRTFFVGIKISN